MDSTINYLNNILHDNDTLVVATSSGPDSMCLLSIVQNLNIKLNIICAHVNHKVRSQSEEEYSYLEDYCMNHNIIFEGTVFNNDGWNFESNARKFRYDFLYKLKKKYDARFILTAHHGDDLIETILMRITRGSNLSGYIGIKMLDKDFLRPLLFVTKEDILKYCKDNNIKYYLDYTNDEDEHTRNRYRHEILPFLKKESSNVHEKYLQFSNELESYECFVNKYILDKELINNNKIYVDKLLKEEGFIIGKAIELLIKDIQSRDFLEVSNETIKNLVSLIKSNKSNARINLSNGYLGVKSYNEFMIKKEEEQYLFNEIFEDSFENNLFVINKVATSDEKSNYVLRLNSNDVKLPLKIRNREISDVMEVKNLGHKKVKDILIDEKVDLSVRDMLPIVVDSNENILWIPGVKKSKFDKEKNEKYDIILVSERKQN